MAKIEIEQKDYNDLVDKINTLTTNNEKLTNDYNTLKTSFDEKENIINTLNNDKFDLMSRLTKYALGTKEEQEEQEEQEEPKEKIMSFEEIANNI